MAKECHDMRELREKVAKHYGRQVVQFSLALPVPGSKEDGPSNVVTYRVVGRDEPQQMKEAAN
jgi:hypothetical protein